MNCADCFRRLVEFLEEDFDPATAASLSEHFAECDGCSATKIEDYLVKRVRDCCAQDVAPADLRDRIVAKVQSLD